MLSPTSRRLDGPGGGAWSALDVAAPRGGARKSKGTRRGPIATISSLAGVVQPGRERNSVYSAPLPFASVGLFHQYFDGAADPNTKFVS